MEKHCQMLYPLLGEDMEVVFFRRKPYVNGNGEYPGIRFVDLPSTKIRGVEALVHSFLAAVCSLFLKPDAVHIHNIGPALMTPLLKMFGIPVVLTYHSANYEHKKWGAFARGLLRFSEKIALRWADRIIFVNRFQMEKFPEKIREKSCYIPNGIPDVKRSCFYDRLGKWGLKPGKYILSVGRITPEKGFHTLIRGFKKLDLPGYQLVIAGGGDMDRGYGRELQILAEDANVMFTGSVMGEDLAQLYSHGALFVLASENEGFPLVLLEAMNYCRNVLVSDLPATHLVQLNAEDYFSVGDEEALVHGLRQKLQAVGEREYDLSDFYWPVIAKQTREVLFEAAEE